MQNAGKGKVWKGSILWLAVDDDESIDGDHGPGCPWILDFLELPARDTSRFG